MITVETIENAIEILKSALPLTISLLPWISSIQVMLGFSADICKRGYISSTSNCVSDDDEIKDGSTNRFIVSDNDLVADI